MNAEQELEALQKAYVKAVEALRHSHEKLSEVVNKQRDGLLFIVDHPIHPQSRFGWDKPPLKALCDHFDGRQQSFLRYAAKLKELLPILEELSVQQTDPKLPYWDNPWFNHGDAALLCTFLALHEPSCYLEIGSGFSTMYARWTIERLGLSTRIISVDPEPRAGIDSLCDEVHRAPLEALPHSVFDQLGRNDVLFFDGSHRSFPNSDVTVFFMEVLPRLPSGVVWHIHDMFLPNDYPADWAERLYNEQYLLAAALLAGPSRYDVSFANSYVSTSPWLQEALAPIAEHPALSRIAAGGGSIWLQMT